VAQAADYARDELAERGDGRFVALVMDFARERDRRPVVHARLRDHVERRRQHDRDVDGLFE
jgi:hypothetical protein